MNSKRKINISFKKSSTGLDIFDALYAFFQSFDQKKYKSKFDIKLNDSYCANDLNILFSYMPKIDYSLEVLKKYDLILLCNGTEPIGCGTDVMVNLLKLDNVYLICNSYLHQSHPLHEKIIWFCDDLQKSKNYWNQNFYPHYYENIQYRSIQRKPEIIAINGQLRSNRHYFFNMLQQQVPAIQYINRISKVVHLLNDAYWETEEDTKFRVWVNNLYKEESVPEPDYAEDNSPSIGIDGKFGYVLPHYFLLPEYFEYSCVVFPESGWQNDSLCMTEKAVKCFYAGSLPFPVGGSNINQFYNDIGFYTAWNLLPKDLQQFDHIKDHKTRYQQAVVALNWLNSNPLIFYTDQFRLLTDKNKLTFLNWECYSNMVEKLHNLITSTNKETNERRH